jgi:hypothetical protein
MSLTFTQYKNSRVSRDFSINYEALCEAIALNDLDFFEFWSNIILPVLETSQSRDENELLNEFLMEGIARRSFKNVIGDALGGLGRFATGTLGGAAGVAADSLQGTGEGLYNAAKKTLGGFGQGYRGARNFDPQALGGPGNSPSAQAGSTPPPLPSSSGSTPPPLPSSSPLDAARQERLAQMQNQVNQKIDGVKRKFSMAMRDFIKNASDEAKRQNDPVMWQAINKFAEKISQTANNYQLNASYGKDTYTSPFNAQKAAMDKSQRDTLKKQLQGKFPNSGTVRGGNASAPVAQNSNFVPMQPGGPSGFQSKESVNNGDDMLIESLIRCTGIGK